MNPFSEDNLVEQTVINLIKEVWADPTCHINAYTDEEDAKLGRDHQGEVVLTTRLLLALEKLNPELPKEALEQAVGQLTRDRSHLSLANANKEIYTLLRDGASVQVMSGGGEYETETAHFFDFAIPANNSFLCVSQLWVVGEMHTRRPDVVLYVNGIPLMLLELKASHKSLVDAYRDNLRDYKDTIPKLLWYNMGIIISNGIENKFGSITSPYEFFNEWKKTESEDDKPKTDIGTIIRGTCDKGRLLDIFENYILFDESVGEAKKIVPRYFQYYGVNRAFQKVIGRKTNGGKLGVFWHTQGSGKSYSMVYLSQKVFRKLQGNFTFVIVTDRSDLDRQAYKNFATVGAVYEQEVHAESIVHLKELLRADHRQIFTTIQKFQEITEAVSTRDDIIVMTDEAHRSQYDLWAMNMRRAMPQAGFIGFTGTPLMVEGEEKTRETFGDYVSQYNFGDSVRDGATVPLYYENRVPRLTNVNEQLEQEIGKVMEFYDLNDQEEEKLESEFSTFYHLVTREDRLNAVARDIVEHFVGRGYDGKAMVVSVDKKTSVRMYSKVRTEWERYLGKLRMDLSRTSDEHERTKIEEKLAQREHVDMAVMVSQSQNEIADLEPFEIDMRPLRNRINTGNLEEEFKKADSNLRIVFVCAMWMTGFDVPNLSTLYLDKPLKNHTLMQAIARANRVSPGKKNGLIVDYIGVFRNIEKALALYAATTGGDDEIIRSKDELIDELESSLVLGKKFLQEGEVDLVKIIAAPAEEKLLLLEHAANAIVADIAKKKKFLNLAADIQSTYRAVLPDPAADGFYTEVTAIRVIASRVRDVGLASVDVSQVKKDLEDLLDRSIQAGEYVIPQHKRLRDLSALDTDALHDFFAKLENKNLQAESLSAELKDKIEEMVRRNRKRAKFMERLNSLLKEYNSGAHDIDQLLSDLVALAKDLNEEEQRSVKEGLTEDELAIFDLLRKEKLNPDETAQVRLVAKELLERLKPKLVPGWRDFEPLRAGVKITISDVLFPKLPEKVYTETDCQYKGLEVYNFVYENYRDGSALIA
ncbi:MAG: type I restriction endonuclease subunit R [Candidatus Pacebacteria bacterium]|nr:type I restriction endonuclease subunit R [Candidatus Paceibacterota bacterium]